MKIIKVLPKTLKGGYKPIINRFNDTKPPGCNPIRELCVWEGGFEIDLEEPFLEDAKLKMINNPILDKNSLVRQVRWSDGKLSNFHYNSLTEEQTMLLFQALQFILGEENVVWFDLI
uniref:Uncharacterized protein n=1 Tax=viral metagenome TaxID=1070528 RepID=A0A6C0HQ08_9ZZZZ